MIKPCVRTEIAILPPVQWWNAPSKHFIYVKWWISSNYSVLWSSKYFAWWHRAKGLFSIMKTAISSEFHYKSQARDDKVDDKVNSDTRWQQIFHQFDLSIQQWYCREKKCISKSYHAHNIAFAFRMPFKTFNLLKMQLMIFYGEKKVGIPVLDSSGESFSKYALQIQY